jgi:hypothetical protein
VSGQLELAGSYPDRMNLEFSGEMWFWKGPAPWHFITVPEEECGELEAAWAGLDSVPLSCAETWKSPPV